MRKERVKPMPTDEEKMQARLKAASADPLVWAMKSVDNKFPDTREKDVETEEAEAAIEEPTEIDSEEEIDAQEIRTEGKSTMPTSEGVVTMEVTPMRQDVSEVSPDEVKKETQEETVGTSSESDEDVKKVHGIKKLEKTPVIVSGKNKMTPMMIAGVVGLVLLAVGGVTFGVVAMVRQNQVTEELESQIAAVNNNQNDSVIEGDYITLKDWGLKIKVVSGLTSLSYNYQSDDYSEVQFWGAKKEGSTNYTPDFAKQMSNSSPLGTVVRVPRYERAAAGRLIWYDDYYNYYYQGPSGVPTVSESEMSWWVESYLLIKEMLTNADNYVKTDDSTIGQQ